MAELKFTKSTDSEQEIKLDSILVYAEWRCGVAVAGRKASLAVGTSFVGDGATVKVTGKSKKGKKLGKLKGEMRANVFVGTLDIPDDIEIGDRVYFEAELSDNSLSGKSDEIPVVPGIQVTNMKWSADEARRGDILKLTADVDNVRDDTEVLITIYEHDRDGAHDKITEIPGLVKGEKIEVQWEYQYHEDTDELPTQEEIQRYGGSYNPPEYFFTVKIHDQVFGKKQESKLLTFKDWFEIELKDSEGNAVANEEYILHLPDGQQKRGTLNAQGQAREEGIPPGRIRVEFPDSQDEHTADTSTSTQQEQTEETQQSTDDSDADTQQADGGGQTDTQQTTSGGSDTQQTTSDQQSDTQQTGSGGSDTQQTTSDQQSDTQQTDDDTQRGG